MKRRKLIVGCVLQAHHQLPRCDDDEPIDSPKALEQLQKWREEYRKAHIVTIEITEAQAEAIVRRLWPGKGLLGATCGKGFLIESAEQASVVNEMLKPAVSINFNFEKHKWMLQTWPDVLDSEDETHQ
jgi:hypothetical protein